MTRLSPFALVLAVACSSASTLQPVVDLPSAVLAVVDDNLVEISPDGLSEPIAVPSELLVRNLISSLDHERTLLLTDAEAGVGIVARRADEWQMLAEGQRLRHSTNLEWVAAVEGDRMTLLRFDDGVAVHEGASLGDPGFSPDGTHAVLRSGDDVLGFRLDGTSFTVTPAVGGEWAVRSVRNNGFGVAESFDGEFAWFDFDGAPMDESEVAPLDGYRIEDDRLMLHVDGEDRLVAQPHGVGSGERIVTADDELVLTLGSALHWTDNAGQDMGTLAAPRYAGDTSDWYGAPYAQRIDEVFASTPSRGVFIVAHDAESSDHVSGPVRRTIHTFVRAADGEVATELIAEVVAGTRSDDFAASPDRSFVAWANFETAWLLDTELGSVVEVAIDGYAELVSYRGLQL